MKRNFIKFLSMPNDLVCQAEVNNPIMFNSRLTLQFGNLVMDFTFFNAKFQPQVIEERAISWKTNIQAILSIILTINKPTNEHDF